MNENDSINREIKKQQLKKRIIPGFAPQERPEPVYMDEEDEEELLKDAHRKKIRKRILIVVLLIALAAGAAAGVVYWARYHQYTQYRALWTETFASNAEEGSADSSLAQYIPFGSNVVKYTRDGASYIDSKGKTIWVQTFEMKSPVASVNGDFIAIADRQGNSIYICDRNGCQGTATTLLPILKVSVSAKGVAAAILEDSKANYITLFRKDGTAIDITIKARLDGDGYPLDLALSPDGTQVICSYMFMNNGVMDCRVVFYNFSEIGKNASPKRLVGGFDDAFSGTMVPRVRFLNDTYSFACSDKGLSFFSSRNLASPELLLQVNQDSEILSLFYSEQYVGIITSNNGGTDPYRLQIFRPNGTLVFEKTLNFQYKMADISGDKVLLWNEDSFRVYNMSGTQKFETTMDASISRVTAGRLPNSYIITSPQQMQEIMTEQ